MLAKLADELPPGDYLYEPKWDGFRAIVFRDEDGVYIQSRDARPFDRYFPELHAALLERLPEKSVVDGEIVIATDLGLDFDALQLRWTRFTLRSIGTMDGQGQWRGSGHSLDSTGPTPTQ